MGIEREETRKNGSWFSLVMFFFWEICYPNELWFLGNWKISVFVLRLYSYDLFCC